MALTQPVTIRPGDLALSNDGYYTFDFVRNTPQGIETICENITITLAGIHNVSNTLAALSTADLLSLPMAGSC